jgi:hypothetical protein
MQAQTDDFLKDYARKTAKISYRLSASECFLSGFSTLMNYHKQIFSVGLFNGSGQYIYFLAYSIFFVPHIVIYQFRH